MNPSFCVQYVQYPAASALNGSISYSGERVLKFGPDTASVIANTVLKCYADVFNKLFGAQLKFLERSDVAQYLYTGPSIRPRQ